MMAMLVSALSLARERELGTFEQLLVTPLRPGEILVGKALPGVIVGLINANIVMAAAWLWFGVPLLGNPALLEGLLVVYLLAGVESAGDIVDRTHGSNRPCWACSCWPRRWWCCRATRRRLRTCRRSWNSLAVPTPVRWMLLITRGVFLQAMPASLAMHDAWPLVLIAVATFGARMGRGAPGGDVSGADQSAVFALLQDPATHGLREPVIRIDTHGAAVFLAGADVYKVKRAVRFPFMDFSTLSNGARPARRRSRSIGIPPPACISASCRSPATARRGTWAAAAKSWNGRCTCAASTRTPRSTMWRRRVRSART